MKLSYEQLKKHLQTTLAPVYFVCGEEPLLCIEACEQIRLSAAHAGCADRVILHISQVKDWDILSQHYYEQSLFAERKLLDVRLGNGKIGKEGAQFILSLLKNPNPDHCLLLSADALESNVRQTAWVKTLEKNAVLINIPKLLINQYAVWCQQYLAKQQIKIDADALQTIIKATEGNLMACQQTLDRLTLQGKTITLAMANREIAEEQRFTLFDLLDKILSGNMNEMLTCFRQLQREHLEPAILLWGLTKQCRELAQITFACTQGKSLETLFQQYRIWGPRARLFQQALQRGTRHHWISCLENCLTADKMMKGQLPGDIWPMLLTIGQQMSRGSQICEQLS